MGDDAAGSSDRHRTGAGDAGDGGETGGQRGDGRLPADAFPRCGDGDDRHAGRKVPAARRNGEHRRLCGVHRAEWPDQAGDRRLGRLQCAGQLGSRDGGNRAGNPAGTDQHPRCAAGEIDRSTLGHPGKFTYCVAEDEEDSTWLPLAEQRGMPPGASSVTVMAAQAPRQIMNEWTTDPREILETFAAEMRANLRHYSLHAGNYALIVPKQLREHIQVAGWSKSDIAAFIHERARIPRREWADVGKGAVVRDRGDSIYPALELDDHLLVIAAGGPAGGFGA